MAQKKPPRAAPRKRETAPPSLESPARAPGGELRKSKTRSDRQLLIAGLGASAGGLEALEKFFKHMPADSGIAFIIVQHLSPDYKSAMPELLARCTSMTVEQARDNAEAEPNRVYIIPPGATLTIKNGKLRVEAPVEPRGHRTPIDSLFRSLAQDRGENAVCIMLSGTGTDGTLGLREIKENGGMAMAQTLDSAKYDAILRSAIATGLVDHVLPVEEMPAKLVEYAAHLHSLNGQPTPLREQMGAHIGKIHGLLRRRAGHDFSQYKESTIVRRLDRRMKALQVETVEQYVQVLEREPEEADRLFKDLLIGVTQFFRDHEAWQTLDREVIPNLFAGKSSSDEVRVCVIGCASGEEAYSIAILLSEHASALDNAPRLKIFATDIDDRGLEMARKGRYPEGIAEHVSAERLERFFIKQDHAYLVKRELREICIFSTHSFIKDPPFSRLDLISCRNVMIYLGPDLQRKIMPLFHYALRSGGYLFLGPSESATSHRELFRTVDKKHRLFQKKESLPRPAIQFPLGEASRSMLPGGKQPEVEERNLPRELERIILHRYAPACVIVNESGDAVFFSGRTSRYLGQPAGSLDTNVINMAREGLRIPLRTALHKAVTTRERAVQNQVPVQTNGGVSRVDLTVEPLAEFQPVNFYMIVFAEPPAAASSPQHAEALKSDASSEETIHYLESELRAAQEYAQAAFEELETSNEELKSANEEYQSTNEELETSKEELQSFNEELETVNGELNRKIAELDHANSDLQNLLESTQIATIFLDSELRIKSFTPVATGMFRLIAGDVGRPITDLAARFHDVDLDHDIRDVLKTLAARQRQLAGNGGQHYQMRILPYRTVHNAIDGVVMTFTDVTDLKQAEQLAQNAKIYAENIIRTVREPLLVLDVGLRVQSANKAFYETFRAAAGATEGRILYELGDGQWDVPALRRLLAEMLPQKGALEDFELDHDFAEMGRRTMLLNARIVQQQDSQTPLILLAIEDITERKRAVLLEDRFRALANTMPNLAWMAHADGWIFWYNDRWYEYTGTTPKDMEGWGWQRAHEPEELPKVLDRWKQSIATGKPFDMTFPLRGANGRFRPFLTRVIPIRDAQGKVVRWFGTNTDISEQKDMENAVRRANENLRRANSDLEQFAYSASHDLQEPIRTVAIYGEIVSRGYSQLLDEKGKESLGYIRAAARRMELLVRDLLTYAQITNAPDQNQEKCSAAAALAGALANLAESIRESGAEITNDALPNVRSLESELQRLFQNLIGNAIKYRKDEEAPRIHVAVQRDGPRWRFSVRDNGIGIAPQYKETVFGIFKRLNSGSKYSGTGIGLAICQKIVERHGGRIWVESEAGKGATFFFTLPAETT